MTQVINPKDLSTPDLAVMFLDVLKRWIKSKRAGGALMVDAQFLALELSKRYEQETGETIDPFTSRMVDYAKGKVAK
jgi:hypothetical protein